MGTWLHKLSNIDEVARMGSCSHCGYVPLKRKKTKPSSSLRWKWRCMVAVRADHTKFEAIKPRIHKTVKQREVFAKRQKNKCAICKELQVKLFVDHCHKTGTARGGLCNRCNVGLGFFADNPTHLRNAAKYVERSVS